MQLQLHKEIKINFNITMRQAEVWKFIGISGTKLAAIGILVRGGGKRGATWMLAETVPIPHAARKVKDVDYCVLAILCRRHHTECNLDSVSRFHVMLLSFFFFNFDFDFEQGSQIRIYIIKRRWNRIFEENAHTT